MKGEMQAEGREILKTTPGIFWAGYAWMNKSGRGKKGSERQSVFREFCPAELHGASIDLKSFFARFLNVKETDVAAFPFSQN